MFSWWKKWWSHVGKRWQRFSTRSNTTTKKRLQRHFAIEVVESRHLLTANPIVVGLVYTEADEGSDLQGDTFELSFVGGAHGTELTRVIIDGDQRGNFGNLPGFSAGDVFFDTVESPDSLGADHAFPFTVVSIVDSTGRPKENVQVRAYVEDGGLQLVIELANFYAGDKLTFTIDVDEVEVFDPHETDITSINEGFDPLVSGAEMQGTIVTATFSAPHYHNAEVTTTMVNYYDRLYDLVLSESPPDSRLDLPRDHERGNRDRTAAAFATVRQPPLPIVIRGTVFHDVNANLQLDSHSGDHPIAGVTLELYQQDEQGQFHPVIRNNAAVTTVTDSDGRYEFGAEWALLPGVYEVRERQPSDYPISVGAIVGKVDGHTTGRVASPDILTDITVALGGVVAQQYDFAEARPAQLSGYLYHDRNNDGQRQPDTEEGIGGVTIALLTVDGQPVQQIRTDQTGFFEFTGLRPGSYQLAETQPLDWIDGQDTPGQITRAAASVSVANDLFSNIILLSDDVGQNFLFGERLGSITGYVYVDQDGDCHRDASELPLQGVTIILRDQLGRERTTRTDSRGNYRFDDLPPGIYTIIEQQPVGYFNGGQSAGTGGGNVQTANQISGIAINSSNIHLSEYNFCEELGLLSGYVYHDRNDNGVRETGAEEGIPKVVVRLYDENGLVKTTTTNEEGYYQFTDLPPGTYVIEQLQPLGWQDGKDSIGFLTDGSGETRAVGRLAGNDRIAEIALHQSPQDLGTLIGKEYNFGEWLPASLAGMVFIDLNGNGILETDFRMPHSTEQERPLAGVTIVLRDSLGQVVRSAVTGVDGKYHFDLLRPGVYSVEQVQPDGYFDGGTRAGTQGGTLGPNRIGDVAISAGQVASDYNFYEHPPATLSGVVFQDGPPLVGLTNVAPLALHLVRDGQYTPDDQPIAGVWLELRSGLDGSPVDGAEALPGTYQPGPIRVQTDAQGRFVFRGLPRGNYAIYQVQPSGYVDSIDTPGTTSGIALNAHQPSPLALLSRLAGHPPPPNDAILSIPLAWGQHSENNYFSEVQLQVVPKWEELPPQVKATPPVLTPVLVPLPVFPPLVPITARHSIPIYGAAGDTDATWHLSIVDGGYPRGSSWESDRLASHWVSKIDTSQYWWTQAVRSGRWSFRVTPTGQDIALFGLPGAIPLAGDFNGDGKAEVAIYYRGHWYIDINGNRQWDPEDLWISFGDEKDLPVVGDWDGDGKVDIGIFGPMWAMDPPAIEAEPGLPDAENMQFTKAKNLPPQPQESTNGVRVLQRTSQGSLRADLIDHVFRYGTLGDLPVTGDWNGDGITNIGVFRKGTWILDTNGDGRFSPEDQSFVFGQEGDLPLVGNFDGKGLPQVAVYREGRVIVDSDRNHRVDATDSVLDLHGNGIPVVGDFNGDGVDEIVLYEDSEAAEAALPPTTD